MGNKIFWAITTPLNVIEKNLSRLSKAANLFAKDSLRFKDKLAIKQAEIYLTEIEKIRESIEKIRKVNDMRS